MWQPRVVDAAHELSRVLGPLRRAVLRRTRDAAGLPDLPDAHIELLRTLEATPGLSVREVADRLQVAPSTVSNLVRATTAGGLVERRPSAVDQRAVELVASPAALALLARYDEASRALLHAALGRLDAADRRAVAAAVPALARLLASLDGPAGPAPAPTGAGGVTPGRSHRAG